MAEASALFRTLKDATTGAAKSADLALEGDLSATNDGVGTLAFKDSSGDLIRPQLTAGGALPVDLGGGGTCKRANGTLTATGTLTDIPSCAITLTASNVFSEIEFVVSSSAWAKFEVYHQDDATATVIETVIVGPGQYTVCCDASRCREVTAGASGTQELRVRSQSLETAAPQQSDMHASLAGKQF